MISVDYMRNRIGKVIRRNTLVITTNSGRWLQCKDSMVAFIGIDGSMVLDFVVWNISKTCPRLTVSRFLGLYAKEFKLRLKNKRIKFADLNMKCQIKVLKIAGVTGKNDFIISTPRATYLQSHGQLAAYIKEDQFHENPVNTIYQNAAVVRFENWVLSGGHMALE